MARIRTAFVSGTILNNPLAIGDVTLSSAALSSLAAVVAPDVALLVLDPAGSAGAPEVVTVTAHTAAATTATITRASEGSTARQHATGIPWVHGATTYDFLQGPQIVGSNTAEVTMTGTSAADLLTISNLNIPVTNGIVITGVARKTAGAAAYAAIGLKVNSTVVVEAVTTGTSYTSLWLGGNTNQAVQGSFRLEVMPRSANYLDGCSFGMYICDAISPFVFFTMGTSTAPYPNAVITSIALRGIVGNALVTLAVKEVVVTEIKYALGT